MSICLRRREFIAGIGGAALASYSRPAIFDFYVLPFNIPKLHQPFRESR